MKTLFFLALIAGSAFAAGELFAYRKYNWTEIYQINWHQKYNWTEIYQINWL